MPRGANTQSDAEAIADLLVTVQSLPPDERILQIGIGKFADNSGWYWSVQTQKIYGNTASVPDVSDNVPNLRSIIKELLRKRDLLLMNAKGGDA